MDATLGVMCVPLAMCLALVVVWIVLVVHYPYRLHMGHATRAFGSLGIFCFSCGILMLPLDLLYSPSNQILREFFTLIWTILSYLISINSWLLAPFVKKLLPGGEETRGGRVRGALRRNLIFFGSWLVVGVATLVTLIVLDLVSFRTLYDVVFTLLNMLGMVKMALLLGFATAKFPKIFFRRRSRSRRLFNAYVALCRTDHRRRLSEARFRSLVGEQNYMLLMVEGHEAAEANAAAVRARNPQVTIDDSCVPEWVTSGAVCPFEKGHFIADNSTVLAQGLQMLTRIPLVPDAETPGVAAKHMSPPRQFLQGRIRRPISEEPDDSTPGASPMRPPTGFDTSHMLQDLSSFGSLETSLTYSVTPSYSISMTPPSGTAPLDAAAPPPDADADAPSGEILSVSANKSFSSAVTFFPSSSFILEPSMSTRRRRRITDPRNAVRYLRKINYGLNIEGAVLVRETKKYEDARRRAYLEELRFRARATRHRTARRHSRVVANDHTPITRAEYTRARANLLERMPDSRASKAAGCCSFGCYKGPVNVLAVLLALFAFATSSFLIWCEVFVFLTDFEFGEPLSRLRELAAASEHPELFEPLVTFATVTLLAFFVIFGVFNADVFGHALLPRATSYKTFFFFSALLGRLVVPLSWNTIALLRYDVYGGAGSDADAEPLIGFARAMRSNDLGTNIGKYFMMYFPLVIPLYFALSLFGVFRRALVCCRGPRAGDTRMTTHEMAREGQLHLRY
eukprot:gnl/Chilomastix_cuspidata/1187.p1 GENE.gnl/Chilomastix_cuspidata/1187~~gnl/Chilomastix_cuspidata/1187.p1  ORF type:complete len:739 (-),score=333.02 gnl/Chilomastix_cuspidata/1187:1136-3352(-)